MRPGLRVIWLGLVLSVLPSVGAFAQSSPPAAPRPPRAASQLPATPTAPAAPTAPAPAAAPPPPADLLGGGQPVNIRLDLTITDQTGEVVAPPKIVTVRVADRAQSQVRSTFDDRNLFMDARPTIVGGRLRVVLTLMSDARGSGPATLQGHNSMTIIVDNGKPIVVLQTADPAANRKMTMELKATIER